MPKISGCASEPEIVEYHDQLSQSHVYKLVIPDNWLKRCRFPRLVITAWLLWTAWRVKP